MADSPGGREVGRVSIRVVPDTSRFRADLQKALDRAEAQTRPMRIDTELDSSRLISQTRRAVRDAQLAAGNINVKATADTSQVDEVTKAIKRVKSESGGVDFGGMRLGILSLGSAALTTVPHTLALAGSLEQVAGVGLLLPGLFTAAAAGIGTLVVGFQGMKTALDPKTAANPAKYAAALANLAPNARAAAKELSAMQAPLTNLRRSVQQEMFAGLSTEIQRLGNVLIPVFRKGMTGIATDVNGAARSFAGWATSAATVRDLGKMFTDIKLAFVRLTPAIAPLLTALRDVSTVGTSFLPGLASGLATAATKFGAFIDKARQTGQLKQWIGSGLTAVQQLGSVVASALRTVQGLLKAAQSAGGGALSGLAGVLKNVANVVNGPTFQKGLTTFFSGLNVGFNALASAMPALGQALASLAPAIAALASGIGKTLAQAIVQLEPVITKMAPALLTLVQSLTRLTGGAITVLAQLLADIASAAAAIVLHVPGASLAISGLVLAFGAKSLASTLGMAGALTKVTGAIKGLITSTAIWQGLKVGFAAADIASAGAEAGNLGRVGAVAGKAKAALGGLVAASGPVALGLVAVGVAAFAVQLNVDRMRRAYDNASEAAAKLKAASDSGSTSLNAFVLKNQNAIKELHNFDGANQKAFLVQVGFDLINEQGLTPSQAFDAVQKLAKAAGITLPITLTVSSLSDTQTQLAAIRTTAVEATKEIDKDPFGAWSLGATSAQKQIKGVAQQAIDAFNADNFSGGVDEINAFVQAVRNSGQPLDAQNTAIQRVSQALLTMSGYSGLSTSHAQTLSGALKELGSDASGAPQPLKDLANSLLSATNGSDDFSASLAGFHDQQKFMASDFAHAHVAADELAGSQNAVASATRAQSTAAADAADRLARQKAATQELKKALDDLSNAITRAIGGDIGLKASQADAVNQALALGQAVKKNGDHFEITTQKGRDNIQAMNTLAQSFTTAATDTIKWGQTHNQTVETVQGKIRALRQNLIDEMVQAGLSRSAAKKLADQYLKIPKSVPTAAKFTSKTALANATTYKHQMLDKMSGLAADMTTAGEALGKDLADGMALGIAFHAGVVADNAAQMTKAAVAAARAAAQSHSPSRVMIALGKDMADGLAIGLINGVAIVSAAGKKLTQAAIQAGGTMNASAYAAIAKAQRDALASVTASLKTQPTDTTSLATSYAALRKSMLATASAAAVLNLKYQQSKAILAAQQGQLTAFSRAQTVHNATTTAAIAAARAYIQAELDAARARGASKKTVADLEAQLRKLGHAHTVSAAEAKAAAAVTKAALQGQIDASNKAVDAAKAALTKANEAAAAAAQAAKDAARALVDSVQAQADALTGAINDFRTQMQNAIQGGQIDLAQLWGATTDANGNAVPGSLDQLQTALAAQLASVQQFSADLQKLAAAGASQDLIAQIAGMGPGAGDQLAQQILAGGSTAIASIDTLMKQISDASAAGAQVLTKQYYQAGVDQMAQMIKGLKSQFPELAKALQQIADMVATALNGATATVSTTGKDLVATYGSAAVKTQRPVVSSGTVAKVAASTAKASAPVSGGASTTAIVTALGQVKAAVVDLQATTAATNDKYLMLKRTGAI